MSTSKEAIKGLEPAILWQRFYEITQVPRPSKKEERITAYIEDLLNANNIAFKKDKVGNLVAYVPATAGYEQAPTVVLQAHSDMVCEKNEGTNHDFDQDPIIMKPDGEWIKANGTTLGADNGIGLAAALAVMTDPSITHGPIEILVTIDEETGLTGATNLATDLLKGTYLLNMDSEEEGIFYIGCAGGIDTVGNFKVKNQTLEGNDWVSYQLMVSGLKGGHSGCDIHSGRGNAIKLLARALHGMGKTPVYLSAMKGGSVRNAIPREAKVTLTFDKKDLATVQAAVATSQAAFSNEYERQDAGVKVSLEKTTAEKTVYAKAFGTKIIRTLLAVPHGVTQMSAEIDGLVETSTNLATIVSDQQNLRIGTSQRSSVDSAKRYIAESVAASLQNAGATITRGDGYPGWKPNKQSKLLQISHKAAEAVYHKEFEVKAIHAGLECGILGGKYPQLDMISFGPTITGAHSPDERVHVPSVAGFYDLLRAILGNLAKS